jgi:hypothetical protein
MDTRYNNGAAFKAENDGGTKKSEGGNSKRGVPPIRRR